MEQEKLSLQELMKLCRSLDEAHGFPVTFEGQSQKYDQVTKDLVGLFGEIGEFSNIIKKINIKIEKKENYELNLAKAEINLKEEIADSLIYLIRIANILEIDLTKETIKKIERNKIRYGNHK
jgi:NTP pyrophosphatase (non-canonical NTP hydrolase)